MTPPEIYGLIGYPVKHSLSQKMHNAAFKERGINAEYRLFEIPPEKLEDFLLKDIEVKDIEGESFCSQDIAGFNITIPHKIKAKEILEKKFVHNSSQYHNTEEENAFWFVELTNAVNTVKREKEELHYFNTDAWGFLNSLKQDLKFYFNGDNVLIIGFGGAGRAVLAGLSLQHVFIKKIYITDINKNAGISLQTLISKSTYSSGQVEFIPIEEISHKIKDCSLLINASSVGMRNGDPSVIDKSLLHEKLYVYDVVYNRKTQLLKDAESLRLRAENGLGMLLYQGMLAFEIWTGQIAPKEVMLKALLEGLR